LWAGVGVLLLSVSIAWTTGVSVLDLLWVGLNLAGVAVLSAIAARACRRAVRERARAGNLARTTPQDAARRAVAEERVRLATDVHQVIRTSVAAMRNYAAVAALSQSPELPLQSVQREGQKAIAELRRLLGLLRDPSPDDQQVAVNVTARASDRWPWWWLPVAESVGMIVVALLEPLLWQAVAPNDALPPAEGFLPIAVTVIAAGLVGVRRLAPSAAAAAFGGVLILSAIADVSVAVGLWTVWTIGLLTWAAAYQRTIASVCGLSVMLISAAAALVLMPETEPGIVIMIIVVVGGMAYLTSRHRMLAGSVGEVADRLAIVRSHASEEAVHAERLTVARELHDVVSHAVVVMVVQAGAAETLMNSDPAAAGQALVVIDQTAATTLDELDRLLAAIDPTSSGGHGQPARRVDDLSDLVGRMRVGGLNVRLSCTADDDEPLDPIVYRIVQETLTNALRHAPAARVAVDVCTDLTGTTVEVADDGPGPGSESRRGYGLVGVTERVQQVGGVVEIGQPTSGSGFRVFARLPAQPAVTS
jgi:signal transduction histidine kinase